MKQRPLEGRTILGRASDIGGQPGNISNLCAKAGVSRTIPPAKG